MAYKTKYNPKNPSKYVGNVKNIVCRSLWERRVCKFLDTNKNITKWSSEEIHIPYFSKIDKKWHRYYPDFLIEKTSNDKKEILLIEVKPEKQTHKPKKGNKSKKTYLNECAQYEVNQAKWKAAKSYATKRGWKFNILTEKDIFP